MATYVMADIHGEIDRFHAMLDLINFSADDQLYIIGDVIDRRAEGVEILLEIINKGNIHLILGATRLWNVRLAGTSSFTRIRRRISRMRQYSRTTA